jgi:hypothetical protein
MNKCFEDVKIGIPLPLFLVIDDVGWWNGKNGSHKNEPYRTGIDREHCIEDYLAIIELGKKINMRIQAGMVLCDWSRDNILKKVPTATWMGSEWNDTTSTDKLDEVASFLNENPQYIELCLHAVGHEFWDDGVMTRAEWGEANGTMRPIEQIKAHLDVFGKIMKQNGLGDFPVSFIPAAFCHAFGEKDGIATILKDYGIKFISTPFDCMKKSKKNDTELFGIDNGIPTVNRGCSGIKWFEMNPSLDDRIFSEAICGIHWPNILHPDPKQNMTTVTAWAEKINSYSKLFRRVLARDTFDFWTQLAHYSFTDISFHDNKISFDFSKLEKMNLPFLNDSFRIKIKTERKIDISKHLIEDISDNCYTIKIKKGENIKTSSYTFS